jgi:hypothetical protein
MKKIRFAVHGKWRIILKILGMPFFLLIFCIITPLSLAVPFIGISLAAFDAIHGESKAAIKFFFSEPISGRKGFFIGMFLGSVLGVLILWITSLTFPGYVSLKVWILYPLFEGIVLGGLLKLFLNVRRSLGTGLSVC